jgi:hypothetical protein
MPPQVEKEYRGCNRGYGDPVRTISNYVEIGVTWKLLGARHPGCARRKLHPLKADEQEGELHSATTDVNASDDAAATK